MRDLRIEDDAGDTDAGGRPDIVNALAPVSDDQVKRGDFEWN